MTEWVDEILIIIPFVEAGWSPIKYSTIYIPLEFALSTPKHKRAVVPFPKGYYNHFTV